LNPLNCPLGEPPALLPVADSRGLLLGTALYSPTSQIALRLVSREAIDEAAWLGAAGEARLRAAIARRKALLDERNDACRLCFSEADELPGLVVDKYGDLVILQLLAKGLDSAAVREPACACCAKSWRRRPFWSGPTRACASWKGWPRPIRPSVPRIFREAYLEAARYQTTSTQFRLNGLSFHYDANSGQKTGAFLDQRANYAAAAEWAQRLGATGRALDVCCYQGGFALHLAQVCARSRASTPLAPRSKWRSAILRPIAPGSGAEVDWVEADAFQILRDWSDAGEKFDAIVLDPPAFAKSQAGRRGRAARLQGTEPASPQDAAPRRPAGDLLLLSSRGLG
jgi:23S rRNA (cytosine1962-C5)-methyltransferase